MSSYHKDFATAQELTVEARAAAAELTQASSVSGLLPDSFENTLTFEFDGNSVGGVPAAVYRAPDSEAPWGRERSAQPYMGKIPPISQKLMLSEMSTLQLGNQGKGPIHDALVKKANVLGQSIAARALLARGEVLATGRLNVANENGLTFTVDFQRHPSLTVTSAAPWSTVGTNIVNDIRAYMTLYAAQNGGAYPDTMTLSSTVLGYLGTNTSIVGVVGGGVTVVLPERVKDILSQFGFSRVIVADDSVPVLNADGTETLKRVIPEKTIVLSGGSLTSGSRVGRGLWGVPAEALQSEYGLRGSLSGIAAVGFRRPDPEGIYVNASALYVPVLDRANSTLAVTVAS